MRVKYQRFSGYLYVIVSVITFILAGCKNEPVVTSNSNTSVTETSTKVQAIDEKISNQMTIAEAKIADFQKLTLSSMRSDAAFQIPRVFIVHTGESIQSVVDDAGEGSTILIQPGVYKESVMITTPGLRLIGLNGPMGKHVVIQNPGGTDSKSNGIFVKPADGEETLTGFSLYNVEIHDFEDNGVLALHTKNFFIARVTAVNNGEYGVYPVYSSQGVVYQCSATGSKDTGIYIGQSEDVLMLDNKAYANVVGFEIENSTNIIAARNTSTDNSVGILVDLLPPSNYITILESEKTWVRSNLVQENNHENFASPGELAGFIPKGSGIIVVGANKVNVSGNTVVGNDFVGIGVGSTLLLAALSGFPPEAFVGIEPNPDDVKVRLNKVLNNGTNPPDLPPPLDAVHSDLFRDGTGMNNYWWKNSFGTSFPEQLPNCMKPGLSK